MLSNQQKWNRYCNAINYCIRQGILFDIKDSNGGNVRYLRAKWDSLLCNNTKEAIITLKPKKYKPFELYLEIVSYIGLPIYKKDA